MLLRTDSAAYWDTRYRQDDTPWTLSVPSPPIVEFIKDLDRSLRILVPGAGCCPDIKLLCESGFNHVTVCDISQTAINRLSESLGKEHKVTFYCGDFFEMPGTFDVILEQTFFCALEPDYRSRYVDKMYDLLSDEGMLAGLLFNRHFDKPGPPFGGDRDEYISLFSRKLNIMKMEV